MVEEDMEVEMVVMGGENELEDLRKVPELTKVSKYRLVQSNLKLVLIVLPTCKKCDIAFSMIIFIYINLHTHTHTHTLTSFESIQLQIYSKTINQYIIMQTSHRPLAAFAFIILFIIIIIETTITIIPIIITKPNGSSNIVMMSF
jgi:hypothetical protein